MSQVFFIYFFFILFLFYFFFTEWMSLAGHNLPNEEACQKIIGGVTPPPPAGAIPGNSNTRFGGYRGGRDRGGYSRGTTQQQFPRGGGGGGRRLNPVDRNGNVSRCVICDSRYRRARDCKQARENIVSSTQGSSETFNTVDSSNSSEVTDKVVESENVHVSLFMGYTNGISQYG